MQQKIMGIDWKTYLGLILAAAAIYVTWWVYQSDLNAKSISVQVVSQVSLQPTISKAMPDIEFTVDGKKLDKPYLTVIHILNDGKRPITSADFEVPLEVRLDSETRLIRTQISEKIPEQLEPKITESPTGFVLQPTLLNPGDSIKVVLINSGGVPTFRLLGRIVGVPTIAFTEIDQKSPNKLRLAFMLSGAVVSILTAMVVSDGALFGRGTFLRRRAALTVSIGTLFVGSTLWNIAMKEAGFGKTLESLGPLAALVPILMFLGALLNRKPPKE